MIKISIFFLTVVSLFGISPVRADGYILPVSGSFRVSQTPGGSFSHDEPATIEAWDLAGSGVPVSVADGVVLKVAYNAGGYGNYVTIRHPDGLVSLYAHLAYASVSPGQTIFQGEQIGIIDSTGKSTGNHLHFSFFKDGLPYSSTGLIDFSELKGGIVGGLFDKVFNINQGKGGIPIEIEKIDVGPFAGKVGKVYTWALGAGAILAFGIIIYGGILYIVSAGSSSKQGEAKEWIKAAIFGLILLLCAYLILSTINPCLVSLGGGECGEGF